MGEYVVKLPDVGEGIAEAEIVAWHVGVGDVIAEDQVLVEMMTDKATVELPSPIGGRVVSLGGAAGDVVAVGAALAHIDVSDEHPPAPQTAAPPTATASAPAPPLPPPTSAAAPRRGRTAAAPAVRRRATALGIDLTEMTGSGPEGRVEHADLDRLLGTRRLDGDAGQAADTVDTTPVIGLRRNIAQRMQIAKARIPHFTYVEEVDVTEAERLRVELNRGGEDQHRLTVLPLLMRAVVVALRDHPQMNARYDDEAGVVHRHHAIHLGVATQTPKGLMVPVVKHAESRDLWACADEVARLSAAARSNTITIEELSGSTITISSLGSLGGIVSTPIINYPEVAIIGVNKIATRPVYVDGIVVPRQIMNLSSSFDHRVIDGADAAAFIQRIKSLLETPALLFVG